MASIPRGATFIDGAQVQSNAPSWNSGHYEYTGTISTSRGGVAPASPAGYELETAPGQLTNPLTGETSQVGQPQQALATQPQQPQAEAPSGWSMLPAVQQGRVPANIEGTNWARAPLAASALEGGSSAVTPQQRADQLNEQLKFRSFVPSYMDYAHNEFKRNILGAKATGPAGQLKEAKYDIGETRRIIGVAEGALPFVQANAEPRSAALFSSNLAAMKAGLVSSEANVAAFESQVAASNAAAKVTPTGGVDFRETFFGITGGANSPFRYDQNVSWTEGGTRPLTEGLKALAVNVPAGFAQGVYEVGKFVVDVSPIGAVPTASAEFREGNYLGAAGEYFIHTPRVLVEKGAAFAGPIAAGLAIGAGQAVSGNIAGVSAGVMGTVGGVASVVSTPPKAGEFVGSVVGFTYYGGIATNPVTWTDRAGNVHSRTGLQFIEGQETVTPPASVGFIKEEKFVLNNKLYGDYSGRVSRETFSVSGGEKALVSSSARTVSGETVTGLPSKQFYLGDGNVISSETVIPEVSRGTITNVLTGEKTTVSGGLIAEPQAPLGLRAAKGAEGEFGVLQPTLQQKALALSKEAVTDNAVENQAFNTVSRETLKVTDLAGRENVIVKVGGVSGENFFAGGGRIVGMTPSTGAFSLGKAGRAALEIGEVQGTITVPQGFAEAVSQVSKDVLVIPTRGNAAAPLLGGVSALIESKQQGATVKQVSQLKVARAPALNVRVKPLEAIKPSQATKPTFTPAPALQTPQARLMNVRGGVLQIQKTGLENKQSPVTAITPAPVQAQTPSLGVSSLGVSVSGLTFAGLGIPRPPAISAGIPPGLLGKPFGRNLEGEGLGVKRGLASRGRLTDRSIYSDLFSAARSYARYGSITHPSLKKRPGLWRGELTRVPTVEQIKGRGRPGVLGRFTDSKKRRFF